MSTEDEELENLQILNQQTFDAEAKKEIEIDKGRKELWDQFLRRVLADNFRIRRANRNTPPEDKDKMIQTTAGRAPAERILSDVDPVVLEGSNYGMVTCIATMNGKKYHNIKLFNKQPSGDWQCVYWHVTEFTS